MTDDRKSESGSAEVAPRMAVLRRHLHDAVPLDQAATDAGISLSTARRWLARYRAELRDRIKASSIMDASAHVADLEDAFRDMWRRWCSAHGPTDSAAAT